MRTKTSKTLAALMAVPLTLSSLVLPSLAQADRKIASVRVPPSQRSSSKSLTPAELQLIHRAAIEKVVSEYQNVHSFADFDRIYLSKLDEKDHKELAAEFSTYKSWPKVHREGEKIILVDGMDRDVLEIPNELQPTLVFNGVSWTFNNRQSFAYQLHLAQRNYEYQKHATSAKFSPGGSALLALLNDFNRFGVPEAHATWGSEIRMALTMGMIGMGLASTIPTLMCGLVIANTKWETEYGLCYDWRKQVDDAKKRATSNLGKVDAMDKKAVVAEAQDQLKWVPDISKVCTTLADTGNKDKGLFVVDFKQLKIGTGNKWEPDGDWFSVVLKLHADGTPDKFLITPKGTDTSDPQWQSKAQNILTFDTDAHLSTIAYRNPAYNALDAASTPMLTQDINALDPTKLTDEQKGRQNTMNALVKSINTWMNFCKEQKFVEDLQQSNVGVEKSNPSPQVDPSSVPSADAPPPTIPNAVPHTVTQ